MTRLPKRRGEYVAYESPTGVRYHIEWSDQRGLDPASRQVRLYGLESVTEGMSLIPRTRDGVARFIAAHDLVLVEFGGESDRWDDHYFEERTPRGRSQ